MLVKKTIRGVVINERVISQPLRSPALGTGVPEGVPQWQQSRVLLVGLIFGPPERPLALDSACVGTAEVTADALAAFDRSGPLRDRGSLLPK